MNLLIISHTAHYRDGTRVVGWEPTVREIDHLSTLFDKVIHIAPLYKEQPPASSVAYTSERIHLRPVEPSGGDSFGSKIQILRHASHYLSTMLDELPRADVVHVRCPANISLMAITLLTFVHHPKYRWAKYAGNWRPDKADPWSYKFQRWWLNKGLHRGVVTINGNWNNQPTHVYSFPNPSWAREEAIQAALAAQNKTLNPPYQILFVGRVEEAKGVGRALEVCKKLKERCLPFHFHVVGDGPERANFEAQSVALGLDGAVTFHGWKRKQELKACYAQAHFLLFPSASEGWPKVLSEAMSYGVVPLAGAVSCISQILENTGAGRALPPFDIDAFVKAISHYAGALQDWRAASQAGTSAATEFTYESYLSAVRDMFKKAWQANL